MPRPEPLRANAEARGGCCSSISRAAPDAGSPASPRLAKAPKEAAGNSSAAASPPAFLRPDDDLPAFRTKLRTDFQQVVQEQRQKLQEWIAGREEEGRQRMTECLTDAFGRLSGVQEERLLAASSLQVQEQPPAQLSARMLASLGIDGEEDWLKTAPEVQNIPRTARASVTLGSPGRGRARNSVTESLPLTVRFANVRSSITAGSTARGILRSKSGDSVADSGNGETTRSNEVYEAHSVWAQPAKKPNKNKLIASKATVNLGADDMDDLMASPKKGLCFIMTPHSITRACWDMLSMLLVMSDIAIVPLQFFEVEETGQQFVLQWFARIFWSSDMLVSLITGYLRSDGAVEMRPRFIVRHYLWTWFFIDVVIVGLDWMDLLVSIGNYASVGRSARILRVMRMLRILRLLRVFEVMKFNVKQSHSEKWIVLTHMMQFCSGLLVWTHVTACLWYAVGNSERLATSWITSFFGVDSEDGFVYRYSCSVHWALSQFAGGMDEIRPTNSEERLFCISVYAVAFVMAAIFVSDLTSGMTQLCLMTNRQMVQLATLRRFLVENNISDLLSLRVQRNAQTTLAQRQRILDVSGVEALNFVSGPLRVELHFQLYAPIFSAHPFLSCYIVECPQVMRRVCHTAVAIALFSAGDAVFNAGEIPSVPRMYVVCGGALRYLVPPQRLKASMAVQNTSSTPPAAGNVGIESSPTLSMGCSMTRVEVGDWLSEAALWTNWMHRGTLVVATSATRLCMLDAQRFLEIVGQFNHYDFSPREYAMRFIKEMNDDSSRVTDLPLYIAPPGRDGKATKDSLIVAMPWLQQSSRTGSISRFSKFKSASSASLSSHRPSS